jgi:hypothetical protein
METARQWIPIIITLIVNVIAVVWAFAKLKERIAVLETKLIEGVYKELEDTKEKANKASSEMSGLSEKVNGIDKMLYAHLQIHK